MNPNHPDSRPERTLESLIDLMKRHRLTHVKVSGMEVAMDPSGFDKSVEPDSPIKASGEPMPTDEQMLFASTGGEPPTDEDVYGLIPSTFMPPKELK